MKWLLYAENARALCTVALYSQKIIIARVVFVWDSKQKNVVLVKNWMVDFDEKKGRIVML